MSSPTTNLGFQNWYSDTLSQSCGPSDTTLYLTNGPTPSEGYLIIDPNNPTTREVIHYTSKGAGTVTLTNSTDRGLDGTSAQSHTQGTQVVMDVTSSMFTALQKGYALSAIPTSNISNPYKFNAYMTNSVTPGSGTVKFDTVLFDTGSNYSVGTGLFTVPLTGYYSLSATITFSATGANRATGVGIFKNGGTSLAQNVHVVMYGGSYSDSNSVSGIFHLTAGDTVYVVDPAVSNWALATGSVTFFTGFLVSVT